MKGLGLLALLCCGLLLADLAYDKHGHYPAEEWFGSFPAIGFAVCVALALAARGLALVTRREAGYYQRLTEAARLAARRARDARREGGRRT
jgi:hypothetical protein